MSRRDYDGVAVCVPVSVPYVRYSIETAHWWIAAGLRGSLKAANLKPADLDGFTVSSFTLFPDTAVGLTQHLGLTPRWLDHIPMGGASGVVAHITGLGKAHHGFAEKVPRGVALAAGAELGAIPLPLPAFTHVPGHTRRILSAAAGVCERRLRLPRRSS